MTEVDWRMPNDDEDWPGKCRERRRRRLEMRRLAVPSAAAGSPTENLGENRVENSDCVWQGKRIRMTEICEVLSSSSSSSGEDADAVRAIAAAPGETLISEPVFGTISVTGRSREMEDAVDVRTSFCSPEISRRRPVHFFAVYDGHGGPHVAAMCREKMHVFVEEELMRVGSTFGGPSGNGSSAKQNHEEAEEEVWEDTWRKAMKRSFERMDEVALSTCACRSVGDKCGCHPMEVALGGSTAVVAVLTPDHIVVANCGDSRAVLCRRGRAIPLSFDHKPERFDELARIESVGGRVIYVNGARVEGILAMSRAIGDKYLKPVVTSEPEITFTKRNADDECLIIASDGLWDVLTSDLACEVVSECLRERKPAAAAAIDLNAGPRIEDEGAGTLYPSWSMLAAAVLTRLALGRKSSDNISVIVVDLSRS